MPNDQERIAELEAQVEQWERRFDDLRQRAQNLERALLLYCSRRGGSWDLHADPREQVARAAGELAKWRETDKATWPKHSR